MKKTAAQLADIVMLKLAATDAEVEAEKTRMRQQIKQTGNVLTLGGGLLGGLGTGSATGALIGGGLGAGLGMLNRHRLNKIDDPTWSKKVDKLKAVQENSSPEEIAAQRQSLGAQQRKALLRLGLIGGPGLAGIGALASRLNNTTDAEVMLGKQESASGRK